MHMVSRIPNPSFRSEFEFFNLLWPKNPPNNKQAACIRLRLVEKVLIQEAINIQLKAKKLNCEIILPVDFLCGKNIYDTKYQWIPVHSLGI